MKAKAVVLLSAGLDSAVNLAWACGRYQVDQAVTFDYGQRAARQEISHAKLLSKHYGVKHSAIPLSSLAGWTRTALVNRNKPLPQLDHADLNNRSKTLHSAKAVWVPNRNGIFLNLAAGLAESAGARVLVVGFNKEESAAFPDNSRAFIKAANQSLFYSTLNHVIIKCKTSALIKPEIVRLGIKLKLPFHLIWSCYEGKKTMCGICESCLRLKRGVNSAAPSLLETLHFGN